jgi:putative DNA primase/helicase
VIEAPRQCIFIGTVNHDNFLKDETGARRFWPVTCGAIDIPALECDRDQLWAESVHLFRAGAKWWLDTDELHEEVAIQQEQRYDGDAWDELITRWVENPTQRYDSTGHPIEPFNSTDQSVSISDVLTHAIGKRAELWTQVDQNRVARALKFLHWERYRRRSNGSLVWLYRRKA